MAKLPVLVLLTTLAVSWCEAHRILVVFPFPSKSHSILGDAIVRHLLAAGNEVVYITPFQWKTTPPNLTIIDNSEESNFNSHDETLNIKSLMEKKHDLNDLNFVMKLMLHRVRSTMEHRNVQKFILDRTQRIDAVVAEWMFSDVYGGFAQIFECPYIMFVPFEHNTMILDLIDEMPNPAYTPSIAFGSVPPFSFTERVKELYFQLMQKFQIYLNQGSEIAIYDSLIKPVLAKLGRPLRSFYESKYNVSLVLVNSHVSLSHSARVPPNYIQIGGFHIDPKVAPLPKDLEQIMNNSKDGVIYFSMGSNLKSKDMPDELKRSLLNMFGTLKQTVLWKFEEILPNLPKNVKILQWAPQPSILAHPNCRLFITHGGLLSTSETVHFGVPIIGIPVFADQFSNVDRAVKRGIAKRVDLSYTMADDLKVAIEEMLGNPSYKEKVKQLSVIYHHRPSSPGQMVSHWVEHVIITKGAAHLRSPASTLSWYQKLYLDLALIKLIALYVLYKFFKKLVSLFRGKKTVVKGKKNK